MFSWLSGVMADTKRSTRNRGLSCQLRNAQNHSNTRRKIPARIGFLQKEFSEKRRKLEAEISIEGNLRRNRYSKMQGKQPNTSKVPNGGSEENIGGKVRTEIASESARQTLTQNWRQLPAQVVHCAPMGPKKFSASNYRRNLASRPGK